MLTHGGGRFLLYTETPPLRVEVIGSPAEYAYDEATRLLTIRCLRSRKYASASP